MGSWKVKPTFLRTTPRDLHGVLFELGHVFARQAVNFISFFFILIEPKIVDNNLLVVVYNCIFCYLIHS